MNPGVAEFALRVSTVTNLRNLALLAAIALLAVTTLVTPHYRSLTPLPPLSPHDPTQPNVLSNDFVISLYKQLLAVKEELDGQKQDLDKMASIERDLCDKRFNELRDNYESQFQREHLAGQQATELYRNVSQNHRQIASQVDRFAATLAELQYLNHSLHLQVDASASRASELQKMCVNQLEALKASHERNCSAQYELLAEQCSQMQTQLNFALTANRNLNASSHEAISALNQHVSACEAQLRGLKSVLDNRLADANLQRLVREAIANSTSSRVCPRQQCDLSEKLCQDMCQAEITRRMAEVDRKVDRAAVVEAQLYHYDVDYALASAGTRIIRNLTSPTFLPPSFRLSSLLKQGMAFVGLEGLTSSVPDISGESVLSHLGLPMGRGEAIEALEEDMNLGSCWAMQGRVGNLTIELLAPITLTAISIDHINKKLARDWTTAPQAFRLFASKSVAHPMQWLLDGVFSWEGGHSVQHFPLPRPAVDVSVITLAIKSNHGNKDYTCLYRIRAHGFVRT